MSEVMKLSIAVKDKSVLHASYMPFLKTGGLFIPTKKSFTMGQKVILVIALLDEPGKFEVDGKVVWITPPEVSSNRVPGIGIQFEGANADELRMKVEKLIAHTIATDRKTHTM